MKKHVKILCLLLSFVSLTLLSACKKEEAKIGIDDEPGIVKDEDSIQEAGVIDGQADVTIIAPTVSSDADALALQILDAVNIQRTAYGVPVLAISKTMNQAAIIRAFESSSFFSHTRPDGTSFNSVCPQSIYAENLAWASVTDANMIVNNWISSPSHSSIILDSSYTTTSIGVFIREYGYVYIAEEFGIDSLNEKLKLN